jgi:hypothetical protein
MVLDKLNSKIEANSTYKFYQRNRKGIKIIEGLFIVILLLCLDVYVIKDHNIKKEIAKNCHWGDEEFFCICEKSAAYASRDVMRGMEIKINLSDFAEDNNNVQLDR